MRTSIALVSICMLLFSCNCNSPKSTPPVIIEKEDTTRISLVKHLLNLRTELEHIETKDSVLANILLAKKQTIDSMVDNALDLKENKINLILVNRKYEEAVTEKTYLVKKVDSVKQEYRRLCGENGKLNNEIANQKTNNSNLTNENLKLKKKVEVASNVGVTGVKVAGLGYTIGLFNKPKEFETNKSSRIKNIKFSCVLPPNELSKKEVKKISFILYSVSNNVFITKDTSFILIVTKSPISNLLIYLCQCF